MSEAKPIQCIPFHPRLLARFTLPRNDENRQNIPLSFCAVSGIGCTDVPVLDHLAFVVEPENIHDRVAARAGLAHRVDVDDHVVALGEDALDLALVVREFVLEETDEALGSLDAVLGGRVVLLVAGSPDKRDRQVVVLLVQHGVVERARSSSCWFQDRRRMRRRGRLDEQRRRQRHKQSLTTLHGDLPCYRVTISFESADKVR